MKLTPIDPKFAFPLDSKEIASFAGDYAPYRISGPPGLARLVMHGRAPTKDQDYWFDEGLFTRLRERAKADLAYQNARQSFTTPRRMLIGYYMRVCLRGDLAICYDWTPEFDSYVILPLRPIDNLVAWVGKIKGQPYYDSERDRMAKDYADKKVAHDLAKNANSLVGGELQFIVNFNHQQNQLYRSCVLGPFDF